MRWIHENPAHWDADKARIVGGAGRGIFDYELSEGELVPGDWWRVEEGGRVLGYGWMDTVWGDAEILLAVDESRRQLGVGTYILEALEGEARARGLNRLYNVVRDSHPNRSGVTRWLNERGFRPSEDGNVLTRSVKPEPAT
jgi:GNAT superfamily N-acetyltransferase